MGTDNGNGFPKLSVLSVSSVVQTPMNPRWPTVKLGEALTPVERGEKPQAGKLYPQLGVRLWGEGAYAREAIDGSQTRYPEFTHVEAGDVVVNKIWARNGSVAVVPRELAGYYVSTEFPTFAPNRDRLDPRWMHWLTKTPGFWQQCDERARGTSGKNRIRPEQFLQVEIPLPTLAEQRRIVARIEQLAAQIAEARRLRLQATEESEFLTARAASHALDDAGWELKSLEQLLAEPPRNGLGPQKQVESGGRTMLRINAVSSAPTRFVDLSANKMVDVSDSLAEPFVLRHDDVFIVRYNGDLNRVAKAAIFKGETDVIYPDKLIRLRPDPKKMLPDFLVYALGSRSVRAQIEDLGKTTAGQIGVSGADAKSFRVPVPPIPEQRRIVAYLDGLAERVAALKQLQAETAAELEALLPSVLDKAFKGQL